MRFVVASLIALVTLGVLGTLHHHKQTAETKAVLLASTPAKTGPTPCLADAMATVGQRLPLEATRRDHVRFGGGYEFGVSLFCSRKTPEKVGEVFAITPGPREFMPNEFAEIYRAASSVTGETQERLAALVRACRREAAKVPERQADTENARAKVACSPGSLAFVAR